MTFTVFALVTTQGTAMADTGVCQDHINAPGVTDRAKLAADTAGDWNYGLFLDVTGNPDIHCLWCGKTGHA